MKENNSIKLVFEPKIIWDDDYDAVPVPISQEIKTWIFEYEEGNHTIVRDLISHRLHSVPSYWLVDSKHQADQEFLKVLSDVEVNLEAELNVIQEKLQKVRNIYTKLNNDSN